MSLSGHLPYDEAKKKGLIQDEEGWLMEPGQKGVANRVINLSGRSIEELTQIISWGSIDRHQ